MLDLFCGCGGMSLGFRNRFVQEDYRPFILGIDIDRDACITYQRNDVGQAVRADVRRLPLCDLKGFWDIVIGCPPCQGFTRFRTKAVSDPRNDLVITFAEEAVKTRADFIIFENVRGILRGPNRFYADALLSILKQENYYFVFDIIDAADFGVPQSRKRVVLIATCNPNYKNRLYLPEKTHCNPKYIGNYDGGMLKPWVTVRQAISDLSPIERAGAVPNHRAMKHSARVLERIRLIPKNGGSRKSLPADLWLNCHKRCRGFNDVYGRMRWDTPSPTITSGCTNPSKGRFTHPQEDRAITPREAARLQTFPDWFIFFSGFISLSRLIGNATPVWLGECIASAISELMKRQDRGLKRILKNFGSLICVYAWCVNSTKNLLLGITDLISGGLRRLVR